MPNNGLRDFFRLRCRQTLEAERHIENLFAMMVEDTENPHLKGMLRQHLDEVKMEVHNLVQVVNQFSGAKRTRKSTTQPAEQVLILVRGFFSGEPDVAQSHRDFVSANPQHIVDIHNALRAEEIVHVNLGNYTGLIVLAKQLGEQEIAGWLQQCIDAETRFREQLESSLWQIIGESSAGMGEVKAA